MEKLTEEQLKRYTAIQDAKAKPYMVVDEAHRKNLQAWVSYDLWIAVRNRVATEGTSMNKFVEKAIATYMLLNDEDIGRIVARNEK